MLTPFGIALRKLRLDKGLRLLDLAELLGQSSAFVSSVETGRKPIPAKYVQQVTQALNLNKDEIRQLQSAADQVRPEVRVDQLTGNQRELVAAFARKVDGLSPDFLDELRKRLLKSVSGEQPFRRRRAGMLVAPASKETLSTFAETIRSLFVGPERIAFPIMDVLEAGLQRVFPDYYLEICDQSVMGADEGRVIAGGNCIILREDVYKDAWRGNGRARYTASHELAHFLMHRQTVMARTREDHQPIYRDAEWQADEFAGRLLMSSRHVGSFATPDEAAKKCGMSPEAARVMLSKYGREGKV